MLVALSILISQPLFTQSCMDAQNQVCLPLTRATAHTNMHHTTAQVPPHVSETCVPLTLSCYAIPCAHFRHVWSSRMSPLRTSQHRCVSCMSTGTGVFSPVVGDGMQHWRAYCMGTGASVYIQQGGELIQLICCMLLALASVE